MILRKILLHLAGSQWMKRFVVGFAPARKVARRFVAGESLSEALDALRSLQSQGLLVTLDMLGENVHSHTEAEMAARDYLRVIEALKATELQCNISLKLTQLGLDQGVDVAVESLTTIVEAAAEQNLFVRVDMEASEYTEATMEVFLRVREKYDNVGIVLQSYLFRTIDDIRRVNQAGGRVRLCKGAYSEPPEVAFQEREQVNRNFIEAIHLLIDEGDYPAIASHDEAMIAATLDHVKDKGVSNDAFEFQMLYGIRQDRQLELLREGYNVRVYLPYGSEWYPYFMRRLAERPANLAFFITALFRG